MYLEGLGTFTLAKDILMMNASKAPLLQQSIRPASSLRSESSGRIEIVSLMLALAAAAERDETLAIGQI